MDGDEVGIDPEIAAAMGFSSFGAQPATKRRKYNHAADSSTKSGNTPTGSGANMTTLGERPKKQGEGAVDASIPENESEDASAKTQAQSDNEEPTIDKKKAKKEKKAKAPVGLADFLAWGKTIATPSSAPATTTARPATATAGTQKNDPDISDTSVLISESAAPTSQSWPQGQPSEQELYALSKGIKNARGDMVYFLPSFLEDPWKTVETG